MISHKIKHNAHTSQNLDSTVFEVDPSSGEISLKNGITLDFNNSPYIFNVTATDDEEVGFEESSEITVTIFVKTGNDLEALGLNWCRLITRDIANVIKSSKNCPKTFVYFIIGKVKTCFG